MLIVVYKICISTITVNAVPETENVHSSPHPWSLETDGCHDYQQH